MSYNLIDLFPNYNNSVCESFASENMVSCDIFKNCIGIVSAEKKIDSNFHINQIVDIINYLEGYVSSGVRNGNDYNNLIRTLNRQCTDTPEYWFCETSDIFFLEGVN